MQRKLSIFPNAYKDTGYCIEGMKVYYKIYGTYLIFFVVNEFVVTVVRVLKDRMHWQSVIKNIHEIDKLSIPEEVKELIKEKQLVCEEDKKQ